MKILIISYEIPVLAKSGGSNRLHQIWTDLSTSFELHFFNSGLNPNVPNHIPCVGHIPTNYYMPYMGIQMPTTPTIPKQLQDIIPQYDYIFCRLFSYAYQLGLLSLPNLILDCDDCLIETLNTPSNQFELTHNNNCINLYIDSINNIPLVLFARDSEKINMGHNCVVYPNKIYDQYPTIIRQDCNELLFVGSMAYPPNYLAVDWWIMNIWPHIIHKYNVTFKVVGAGAPTTLVDKWCNTVGVKYSGFVKNIEDVYANVLCSIVPVTLGSGTHIKVLESLIMEVPCIVSTFALRGYEDNLKNNEQLFVADTVDEWMQQIDKVIVGNIDHIVKNGKCEVLKQYSYSDNCNLLSNTILNGQFFKNSSNVCK